MPNPTLPIQARGFAEKIQHVLNCTITDGITISSVVNTQRNPNSAIVGYGIAKNSPALKAIPLRLTRAKADLYLNAAFTLSLDDQEKYLMVTKSIFGLYLEDDFKSLLVHWDYERNPSDGYPRGHLQIDGVSDNFNSLLEIRSNGSMNGHVRTKLADIHFPVGGRRFRPVLEDVIEFLIFHDLVDSRQGSTEVIQESREEWDEIQAKAAVRRFPEAAKSQLMDMGFI